VDKKSGAKKHGRFDCPACARAIHGLVHRGSFFHVTSHCPYCGVRLSTDIFMRISGYGMSLIVLGDVFTRFLIYPLHLRWLKPLSIITVTPFLLYGIYYVICGRVKGSYYQIVPDGTSRTSGTK